jgi:hypothetical protein
VDASAGEHTPAYVAVTQRNDATAMWRLSEAPRRKRGFAFLVLRNHATRALPTKLQVLNAYFASDASAGADKATRDTPEAAWGLRQFA